MDVACQRRSTRASFVVLSRLVEHEDTEDALMASLSGTGEDFPCLSLHSGVDGEDLG